VSAAGRDDLAAWSAAQPANFYDAVPALEGYVGALGGPLSDDRRRRLWSFGATVATGIDPLVATLESARDYPRHHAYDAIGRRVDEIEFHPADARVRQWAWSSGMISAPLTRAGAADVAALFFLLSHAGEGGVACPAVCTIGLRRAIEHRGDDALRARFLEGLRDSDARHALRGSQFLTEVQGGSDVGANEVEATPDPDEPGAWRLSGEKWFCSVADADLFAVTARPAGAAPGTRGLGCFVVPRTLDAATPNGFTIRRLKDKLGTRALASAEIDFDGALAWPVGDVSDGFSVAVTELLNTSRWLNALGSCGLMSRAALVADSFARHRRAFTRPIIEFPLVAQQVARLEAEAAAALASTMAVTALVGAIDEGGATPEEVAVHRFLVNANKYVTSVAATDAVHGAIEVLGGNGTIEDFSPLPRLYRDSIVFESWEGTHNVLCEQVRRDCARLGLLAPMDRFVSGVLGRGGPDARELAGALADLRPRMDRAVADPERGSVEFRPLLERYVRVVQAGLLLSGPGGSRAHAAAIADRHVA
jgi:alkylation response protein AidB-like acyl-CoA dehydrogenase